MIVQTDASVDGGTPEHSDPSHDDTLGIERLAYSPARRFSRRLVELDPGAERVRCSPALRPQVTR